MSGVDQILLILHIGFAIFALGPLTAATMSTPRYIRRGDHDVVRYLNRVTRIYGLLALGIFLFGALLASGKFNQVWLSASMTLFAVAIVLLVIVERDQRKALHRLDGVLAERRAAGQVGTAPAAPTEPAATEGAAAPETAQTPKAAEQAEDAAATAGHPAAPATHASPGEVAKVEIGRIATISGVVALIWIVILILMVVYA